MPTYYVSWDIDIEAESPEEAAVEAWKYHIYKTKQSRVFDVVSSDDPSTPKTICLDKTLVIHHDIDGYYLLNLMEVEEERATGESVGFDGRPHYATKEEAEHARNT